MLQEFIKKRIEFNFSKQKLKFDLNQSLFSSTGIDEGTKILLNTFRKNPDIKYENLLDLGCGYGIIGIFLKKQNPQSHVTCVDRNSLATEFTKHNAKINNLEVDTIPSLGYNSLNKKFDFIVTNYPAKAGINALKDFVYNAYKHLNPNGIFAIVIVKELREDFKKILNDKIRVIFSHDSIGYSVYHLKFLEETKFTGDVYTRKKILFNLGKKNYKMETAINIPEFDSLHNITKGMIYFIKKMDKINDVTIINPFQGHLALAIIHYLKPKKVSLVSKDLLSLTYSEKNLKNNRFFETTKINTPFLDKKFSNVLFWNLDIDEEIDLIKKRFETLKKLYPTIILGGQKNVVKKLIEKAKIKTREEKEIDKFKIVVVK